MKKIVITAGLFFLSMGSAWALIEPNLHTLGDDLIIKNDGKKVGWFSVGCTYGLGNMQLGETIALRNEDKPEKMFYLWGPYTRIQQLYRGTARLSCWRCSGSGAKDPQEEPACADPSNKNYCITCPQRVPCSQVLSVMEMHADQGVIRIQDPSSIVSQLLVRLDLVKPEGQEVVARKPAVTKPEVIQPKVIQPEAKKPEVEKQEVNKPKVEKPEVIK